MDGYALDDAAAAALWAIRNAPREHIGLLYEQDGTIRATPTRPSRSDIAARGKFVIPAGSLRGIFHNHPEIPVGARRKTSNELGRTRSQFSLNDIAQARLLGVPSYIAAGNKLRRYDPATGRTEDVLAEIPIELIRDYFHRRFFEGRDK